MSKVTPLEKLADASLRKLEVNEPRPNAHFDVTQCTIIDESNKKLDWPVLGGVKEMPLEMTITGASTVKLYVEDPHFELLNDPIFANWMFKEEVTSRSSAKNFTRRSITDSSSASRYGEEEENEWILPQRPIDLNIDGIFFRLAGWELDETTLILKFEDRIAVMLREMVGTLISRERGQLTRAEFIVLLAREAERRFKVRIPVFCPEEKIVQAIREPVENAEVTDTKESAQKTVTSADGITIGGSPANEAQLTQLNEALEAAEEAKAPFKAQVAMFEVLIEEGDLGKQTATGPFGIIGSSQYVKNNNNVKEAALAFLQTGFAAGITGAIDMARTHPHLSAAEIAQEIEVSSGGSQSFAQWREEAEHIVHAAGIVPGNEKTEGLAGPVKSGAYAFTRGPYENSWDCIQRLASEVSWYAFVRDNQLFYVSGNFLLAQGAKLSLERGQHGIDWIKPNIEIGARDSLAEVTIKGRASLWSILPGQAVALRKVGPASTKWVVNSFKLDILDRSDAIQVKLQLPLPARPEPASGSEPIESSATATQGTALAAYQASEQLSAMALPYLWGGGHTAGALVNVAHSTGLDCSGSTCWVLHEAGMFPATQAIGSGEFSNWGEAGRGKEMTVWYNAEHVFIEFTLPSTDRAQLNTAGPENGPRLYDMTKTTGVWPTNPAAEGFSPRHWRGT